MKKLKIRKLKDWKFFFTTPLGVILSIFLATFIYRIYTIGDNNIGRLISGISIFSLFIFYYWFDDYKNKCYANYCSSINLMNGLKEQMEGFDLNKDFSKNFYREAYLSFLNKIYMEYACFEHVYVLSKIQNAINSIIIKESNDPYYLNCLFENLKEDIYNRLNQDIETYTEAIAFLLEKS
jgi:hypothetical protein